MRYTKYEYSANYMICTNNVITWTTSRGSSGPTLSKSIILIAKKSVFKAPKQIKKMSLLRLPSELLLVVADFLEVEGDINALAKINHRFYSLPNPYLYRRNSLESGSLALLWAVQQGREATARKCVSEGANVRAIDGACCLALHGMATRGW